MKEAAPRAFPLSRVDIAIIMVIIGVLIGLLLPAVMAAREAARMMSCNNNFKQIGLALHNYHSAFNILPATNSGTGPTIGHDDLSNQRRLSALVAIVPFVEASALWETISNPYVTGKAPPPLPEGERLSKGGHIDWRSMESGDGPLIGENDERYYPAMGPSPWCAAGYPPWQLGMPTFRCPSDSTSNVPHRAAFANYAFCFGDGIHDVGNEPVIASEHRVARSDSVPHRGIFTSGRPIRFREIVDGLSNTIAMAEVATYDGTRDKRGAVAMNVSGLIKNPSLCLGTITKHGKYMDHVSLRFTPDGKASRGGNWADGAISWMGFNTILPPNSPSCDTAIQHLHEGVFSASSRHRGGVHVLLADGAVVFITENIDAGNSSSESIFDNGHATPDAKSPYGLWGALGTRASSEDLILGTP